MHSDRDCDALLALLAADRLPVPDGWPAMARQAATGLAWRDLLAKAHHISDPSHPLRSVLTVGGPRAAGETGIGEPMNTESVESDLQHVDVLVICPLAKEMNPASRVFEFDPFDGQYDNFEGHKIFHRKIQRSGRTDLSVAISVINQPRNVPMAIGTLKLLSAFKGKPELVVLSGIGAGVRGKVNLGDVIISTTVIDIAGGRMQIVDDAMRDDEFPVDRQLLKQIRYLPARLQIREKWSKKVKEALNDLNAGGDYIMPAAVEVESAPFAVEDATIVAGEKLVADGSLPTHLKIRDDRIRSCGMEDSGFAQAAEESRTRWVIFRGISDFGEPDKNDLWQATAAFAAALAARRFLETEFHLAAEIRTMRL